MSPQGFLTFPSWLLSLVLSHQIYPLTGDKPRGPKSTTNLETVDTVCEEKCIKICPEYGYWGCRGSCGKIALHLLFGWSLDKYQKSLDQSKLISGQFRSIQTKAFPNPDQPGVREFQNMVQYGANGGNFGPYFDLTTHPLPTRLNLCGSKWFVHVSRI